MGVCMSDNIQLFDQLVAKILNELYCEFPNKIFLDACGFFENENKSYCDDNGNYINTLGRDADFFNSTVSWLYDTGYLNRSPDQSKYTLSIQGLQLLKSIPSSVDDNKSLGDSLKSCIKKGMYDAAAKLISDALSVNNLLSLIKHLMV